MIKKGLGVTILFVASAIIQLFSQIVVTRMYGATFDLDVFIAAVTIPTIMVTIIYGTLNDSFLPLYGQKFREDPKKADEFYLSNLIFLTAFALIFTWIIGFFSTEIAHALYGERGGVFVKNVSVQLYFMFFSLPMAVVAAILGAYFYAHKHFMRFPLAQAIGSIANLALIILLAPIIGIWAMVIAFVANIAVQIVCALPKITISFKLKMSDVVPVLVIWIPWMIGTLAMRSDQLLLRSFAATLPTGYIVYTNLIYKIFTLATSLMTIGIQTLLLPHLVEYISSKNRTKAEVAVIHAKYLSILISLVIIAAVMTVGPFIIRLLFVGGKFKLHDANTAISLLPYFILPSLGYGINTVFFQPLLAMKKNWIVGVLNIFALCLAWGAGIITKTYFGPLYAIAVSLTTLLFVGIVGSELLWRTYRKHIQESPQP